MLCGNISVLLTEKVFVYLGGAAGETNPGRGELGRFGAGHQDQDPAGVS